MITFASLILGLVIGVQPITVLVDDSVVQVELLLDGRSVGRLDSAPWTLEVDFGRDLVPHLLEARSLAEDGTELGRARQWINLPRPPAEAKLLVEPGEAGRGVARVVWDSIAGDRPVAYRVELDGRPLEVADLRRFDLPPLDADRLHYLRVELQFADNVASTVEATFGGSFTAEVESHQMAVPIQVERRREGSAANLQGRISKEGEPLRVLAVDEGPVEIVVVRDRGAQPALDALARYRRTHAIRQLRSGVPARTAAMSLRSTAPLKKGQSLWILEPVAQRRVRAGYDLELFAPSPTFTRQDGGLYWVLASVRPSAASARAEQRLADAVAVAGMTASARNRRRAVILIVGESPEDSSQHRAATVKHYLETLRVPLFVWSTAGEIELDGWGAARDVSTLGGLEQEMREVQRMLDRQRIVWLEGFHLPQRIRLAGEGDGRPM